MPDCFISYSSQDAAFAAAVHRDMTTHGVSTFMAAISLRPGDRWSERIHEALRDSDWVVLLASRAACASPYVQQEVGRAVDGTKKLIPVVWDMAPADLPGWANQHQAVDIRGATPEQIQARIIAIARQISQDKAKGMLIAASLLAGLFVWGSMGDE